MSSLYNLEPQPTAKVLLQTTSGDIELELFAKQTPLTSRNFLQLCLDGYYTNTIFHRLVPGFIIQGGDPTGTGSGGEAIYDGGLFADEFHSRLKFNRRGLLGMANTGRKDDNGSQFFLTLGKTEELSGRNTLFGRVAGETIYNLMRMGEAEVVGEGSERPLYPTRVTGAEVLVNPFEDMVRRETKAKPASSVMEGQGGAKKKPKKRAAKTLLSFGGEEEEGEDMLPNPVAKKAKFNTKLVVAADEKPNGTTSTDNDVATKSRPTKTQPSRNRHTSTSPSPPNPPQHQPRKPSPSTQLPIRNPEIPSHSRSRSPSTSPDPEPLTKFSSLLTQTNVQIASLKASMKRTVTNSARTASPHRKSALEQMIPAGSTRGRKRKAGAHGSSNAENDRAALAILTAFREKLDRAPPEAKAAPREDDGGGANGSGVNGRDGTGHGADGGAGAGGEEEEEEEAHLCDLHFIASCQSCRSWDTHALDSGGKAEEGEDVDDRSWMSHALSFEKDRLGKDLTWRRKIEEELVVIDPREKGKDIREEERRARKGGGGRG